MRENKLEFSKIIFIITSILVFIYYIFMLYDVHNSRLQEPITYIGASNNSIICH